MIDQPLQPCDSSILREPRAQGNPIGYQVLPGGEFRKKNEIKEAIREFSLGFFSLFLIFQNENRKQIALKSE